MLKIELARADPSEARVSASTPKMFYALIGIYNALMPMLSLTLSPSLMYNFVPKYKILKQCAHNMLIKHQHKALNSTS